MLRPTIQSMRTRRVSTMIRSVRFRVGPIGAAFLVALVAILVLWAARPIEAAFPGARLVWFEKSGHFPMWDQPDETIAAILEAVG